MNSFKCAAGNFQVFHAGRMLYVVIDKRTGDIVDKCGNLSSAFSRARRLHEIEKSA